MEICWLRKLRPRDVGPAGFHFSDVISSSVAFIPGHSHPHSLEPEEKCGSFVGSLGGEERIDLCNSVTEFLRRAEHEDR